MHNKADDTTSLAIETARRHTRAMRDMNMRAVLAEGTVHCLVRADRPCGAGNYARYQARYANGRFVPHLQLGAAAMRYIRLVQLDVGQVARES